MCKTKTLSVVYKLEPVCIYTYVFGFRCAIIIVHTKCDYTLEKDLGRVKVETGI